MKKLQPLALALFFLLAACKQEGNKLCLTPGLTTTVAGNDVTVNIEGHNTGDGYDMEYGPAGFTQGTGTTTTSTGSSIQFTVIDNGNYDVYVRRKCPSGGVSEWVDRKNITVDGSYSDCPKPFGLSFYSGHQFSWGGNNNFYDVEYGPTGFTLGNGTQVRTNSTYTYDAILHQGVTYDFYVRGNCGGSKFSHWVGPHSHYADSDHNINVPCTTPTDLYAYKTSSTQINYTAVGHGSVSYEVSISTSSATITSNILTNSSPNGGVYNSGGYSGTRYFWIRGKCDNGSFTNWAVSQVQ